MNEDKILEEAGYILQRRALRKQFQPWVESDQQARELVQVRFPNKGHEEFGMICLDSRMRLLDARVLFRGTVSQTTVYPRIVVARALLSNASNVIFVHNHPADGPPSEADVLLTTTLEKALKLVDVRVLDHLVVTTFDCISMHREGLFTPSGN